MNIPLVSLVLLSDHCLEEWFDDRSSQDCAVPGSLYATHVAQPMDVVACCGWRARGQACICVHIWSFVRFFQVFSLNYFMFLHFYHCLHFIYFLSNIHLAHQYLDLQVHGMCSIHLHTFSFLRRNQGRYLFTL